MFAMASSDRRIAQPIQLRAAIVSISITTTTTISTITTTREGCGG